MRLILCAYICAVFAVGSTCAKVALHHGVRPLLNVDLEPTTPVKLAESASSEEFECCDEEEIVQTPLPSNAFYNLQLPNFPQITYPGFAPVSEVEEEDCSDCDDEEAVDVRPINTVSLQQIAPPLQAIQYQIPIPAFQSLPQFSYVPQIQLPYALPVPIAGVAPSAEIETDDDFECDDDEESVVEKQPVVRGNPRRKPLILPIQKLLGSYQPSLNPTFNVPIMQSPGLYNYQVPVQFNPSSITSHQPCNCQFASRSPSGVVSNCPCV